MKRILIVLLMLMMATTIAAPPTRSYPYGAGNIIQPAEVTANEDNLYRYLTAGVDVLAANSVATSNIQDGSVTSSKILDGTIVSADISNTAAIPYSKLTLTGLISGADLAGNIAITTTGKTTTSGLYVTGRVQDKDGDYGTTGQVLSATNVNQVNWTSQKVAQIVNSQTGILATGTTTIPYDDTIPQQGAAGQDTEGDTYLTLNITPTSATNTLKIDVAWFGTNSAANQFAVCLFQQIGTVATTNALAVGSIYQGAGIPISVAYSYYMTTGTTSTITFKVKAGGNNAGTTSFNGGGGAQYYGGVFASSITITEYTP